MKKILSIALAALMLLSLTSCAFAPKPKDKRVVLTLSGEKIYYDYFRYVFLNTKADMDGGDENYWTENPEKLNEFKESVLDTLVRNRAIQLLSKKYKVKLTRNEKKEVLEYLEGIKSDPTYKESLKSAFLTEYALHYVQTFTKLWGKTYDRITSYESGIIKSDDERVKADIDINFRRIRFVLIEYTSKNKAEKLEKANEVLEKAQNGEDFVELVKTYCDDSDMVGIAKDGRYYTIGQIIESVENEVEKLDENEISGVIELNEGYFIIQRLPLEEEYVNKHFGEFVEMYVARVFNEMVTELEKTVTVKTSKLWDNLKITDVK